MFDMPVRILSVFPDLLTFSMIGIFLLRIALGFIIFQFAYYKLFKQPNKASDFYHHVFKEKALVVYKSIAYIEFLAGVGLIFGVFTQVWSLIVGILMALATYFKIKSPDSFKNNVEYYALLCIIAISLLFMGAGAFAVDYPL